MVSAPQRCRRRCWSLWGAWSEQVDKDYRKGVNLPGCSFGFSVAPRWGGFRFLWRWRVSDGDLFYIGVLIAFDAIIENKPTFAAICPSSGIFGNRLIMMRSTEEPHPDSLFVEFRCRHSTRVHFNGRQYTPVRCPVHPFNRGIPNTAFRCRPRNTSRSTTILTQSCGHQRFYWVEIVIKVWLVYTI